MNNNNNFINFSFTDGLATPSVSARRGRPRNTPLSTTDISSNAETVAPSFSEPATFTTRNWDYGSSVVLIELFGAYNSRLERSSSSAKKGFLYGQMQQEFNANEGTNGARSVDALKRRWDSLSDTFRSRLNRISSTGAAPIEHWEFHEAIENVAGQFPTIVPPTVYSSYSQTTTDNRSGGASGMRRQRYEDEEDQDEATENQGRRRRRVNPSINFLVDHMNMMHEKEIEARRRYADLDFERKAEFFTQLYERGAVERQQQAQFRSEVIEIKRGMLEVQRFMLALYQSTLATTTTTDSVSLSSNADTIEDTI